MELSPCYRAVPGGPLAAGAHLAPPQPAGMAAADADAAEKALLAAVDRDGQVDSAVLAATLGVDHLRLVGTIKSLESFELVAVQARPLRERAARSRAALRAARADEPHIQRHACRWWITRAGC